ncbi:MAG: hypothetical protein H0U85_08735 [Gemmatimonadales bacterium]|nr:hypothetical protein [Gemmatimonadales bacterium]
MAGVIGQEVFVVGGSNSGLVEAYSPAANAWRSAVALPSGSTVGVGFLNGTIYAVVGSRMYSYQP